MEKGDLVKKALFIRRFEEKLLSLFSKGELFGTIHTCIGQEWTAVAASGALRKDDTVFSNHRCHGHFLALTGNASGLLAEIMGRPSGVCGGRGGSQHLYTPGFYSNGIQGGMVPVSAGRALAGKMDKDDSICVAFIGDGTLGQGVVYESLNIASKWAVPLLIVVENNGIAQSTPSEQSIAGTVEARAKAFNIKYLRSNTWEWKVLLDDFRCAAGYVREHLVPFVLEVDTYRLKAHSKGDDTRDAAVINRFEEIDPLSVLARDEPRYAADLLKEIDREIEGTLVQAKKPGIEQPSDPDSRGTGTIEWSAGAFESDRISTLIYKALKRNLQEDPRIILIGEDVEAPYGGAFKVTRDLSQLFPGRVRNTPISEGAITGLGTGLALGGYRPIVEIMFGDFITLSFDQIVNHACKFQYMYNDQVKVPLIIRTPMGGKRGYGPTHSQSLEKHLLGVSCLDIIALNIRVSPEKIYNTLFQTVSNPTLVIENKVLYTRFLHTKPIAGYDINYSSEKFPSVRMSPQGREPEVTIFCYGGMLEEVEKAIEIAFDEYDIICEVICPVMIQPLDIRPVLESIRRTRRLVTVEEGSSLAALSSEVAAQLVENGGVIEEMKRVACNAFIPCSRELEKKVLPGTGDIISALREVTYAPV